MNSFSQLNQLLNNRNNVVNAPFNMEQFKTMIPNAPDSLISKVIAQARMQGISEEHIRQGIEVINKYR